MEKKNLANKLTILRIILTAVLAFFMLLEWIPILGIIMKLFSIGLFIGIAYTDYLDGKIARENGEITNFGKLLDPIADKIFVYTVLIILLSQEKLFAIVVVLLIVREFVVDGVKMLLLEKGEVVAASKMAKYKTISQMVALLIIMILPALPFLTLFTKIFSTVILLPALVFSYISMFDYLKKVKPILANEIDEIKNSF